ncbi:unnamed protein product [Periconia digitata]|uniref:Uncharacterized protein n=1 Tax=Periconia digitata TaxID=1303443 RepID=A0A9W4UBL3_9PLEO|nr:unnamed protein product [Periconia digitata]
MTMPAKLLLIRNGDQYAEGWKEGVTMMCKVHIVSNIRAVGVSNAGYCGIRDGMKGTCVSEGVLSNSKANVISFALFQLRHMNTVVLVMWIVALMHAITFSKDSLRVMF